MENQTLIPTISNALHSTFASCMSSEIFELVAQDDARFFVHKDILAHQSQPFKEATSGVWKESTERKILLEDWDAKTVGHLVQFLYTGDYKYPNPSSTDAEHPPVAEEQSVTKSPNELETRVGNLAPFLECIVGSTPERSDPRMTDSAWLDRVDTSTFDFEETLLTHAKLYTLAHYKSIAALKALAQERLSGILLKLHPLGCNRNPHLAMNIVNLATFVYANTDSLSNSAEPLRNILSHFVALNLPTLYTNSAAVEIICRGGDFVGDVLAKLCTGRGAQIAPPGTRFINGFNSLCQDSPPPEYVPELDSTSGKVKDFTQTVWLVPRYTTDVDTAATHFYISLTEGCAISTVIGRSCGSTCHIRGGFSEDVREKIITVALVRCTDHFLDMGKFREYDGVLSHSGHSVEAADSFHFLWKSVKTSPV